MILQRNHGKINDCSKEIMAKSMIIKEIKQKSMIFQRNHKTINDCSKKSWKNQYVSKKSLKNQ